MATILNPLSHLITDPVRNFKFLITFTLNGDGATNSTALDGMNPKQKFGQMGFVSLSGLSVSTESIAYREGGYNTNVHQMPGQSSFTPITLSRGVLLGTDQNVKWMKRLFSVLQPTGGLGAGVGGDFRTSLDIQVLSHPNPAGFSGSEATTPASTPEGQHTSMRFRVYNAWISSLAYSPLDAGSNALMVEEMTLVHEGFDVKFASDLTTDTSAKEFDIYT